MFCSAKKATVVTVDLSPTETIGVKTTANLLRNLNNLIVEMTHNAGDYEDFFYNVYGIVDFLNALTDNPAKAEKILADYIDTLSNGID